MQNLIAAAQHAYDVYRDEDPAFRIDDSMAKLAKAIAAAEHAAKPTRERAMQIEGVDFFADPSATPGAVKLALGTLGRILERCGITLNQFEKPASVDLANLPRRECRITDLDGLGKDMAPHVETKRVKLGDRFWEIVNVLDDAGKTRVSEALSLLGEAIESVEVRDE
jgi:hypothetical protein